MIIYILLALALLLTARNIVAHFQRHLVDVHLGASLGLGYLILVPLSTSLLCGIPLPAMGHNTLVFAVDPFHFEKETLLVLAAVLIWGVVDAVIIACSRPGDPVEAFEQPQWAIAKGYVLFIAITTLLTLAVVFVLKGLNTGGLWSKASMDFMEQSGIMGLLLLNLLFGLKLVALAVTLAASSKKSHNDADIPAGASLVSYQVRGVRSTSSGDPAQFNVRFGAPAGSTPAGGTPAAGNTGPAVQSVRPQTIFPSPETALKAA